MPCASCSRGKTVNEAGLELTVGASCSESRSMVFHVLAYAESNVVVKMINKCICDVIMMSFVMINRW